MMLNSILSWTWIGSGVLLIVLVLLHSPKGDGMGGLAASGSFHWRRVPPFHHLLDCVEALKR